MLLADLVCLAHQLEHEHGRAHERHHEKQDEQIKEAERANEAKRGDCHAFGGFWWSLREK